MRQRDGVVVVREPVGEDLCNLLAGSKQGEAITASKGSLYEGEPRKADRQSQLPILYEKTAGMGRELCRARGEST